MVIERGRTYLPPTIYGTGPYLRIGDAAATSHSLDSEDDLMVTGELEVDGAVFFDGGTVIIGAGEGGVVLAGDATIRPPNLISGAGDDNVAGADFYIKGALGRGAGDVGQIIFQTAQVAAADTIQTYETILTLDEDLATFAKAVTLSAVTLGGTVTLNGQVFDAGAVDAIITTTGSIRGVSVQGSHATYGPLLSLKHTHTTPDLTCHIGGVDFWGYDGAGSPASFRYGLISCIYANVTDTSEAAQLDFYLATAGAADNLAMTLSGAGALWLDAGLTLGGDISMADTKAICTGLADADYFLFKADDRTVGLVEVGRVSEGTDPFFQIGRDDTGVAINAITDMLILQAGAGANNEAAGFGLGISFKLGNAASEVEERASIDAYLATATDGAEASYFHFNTMAAGAMVKSFTISHRGITSHRSTDSAAIADEVSYGGYDLSADNRVMSISAEKAVTASGDIASTHTIPIRYNGVTYNALVSNV